MAGPIRTPIACAVLLASALLPERGVQTAALAGVGAYRAVGSPILRAMGIRCRFEPSCSRYAQLAIAKYGVSRGVWKTSARILRCNPLTTAVGTIDYP